MLFQAWTQKAHRPTEDLDLLGQGNLSTKRCEKVFREICNILVADDGLVFFPETVRVEKIKEEQEYEGVRFLARLENARIPLQVDIGFGDDVTPSVLSYPTLLSMPAPRIQAYPMDTVVAEKAEAIQPWHAQQPYERLLRYLVPGTDISIRRASSQRCGACYFWAAQDTARF